jgi:tripartite-type tricarboxylate transporter receptor subunit TctC
MRGPLGQPVIVENVGGADGSLGTGRAARARPDGYTVSLGVLGTQVLNSALYSLNYDAVHDLQPILPLVNIPFVLFARKTMPAIGFDDLVMWLKANPGKASAGVVSTILHLETIVFQKEAGVQLNLIPYRGGAPAMQDLVAGQIDLMFVAPDALSLMQAGSIKAYAVTGKKRLVLAPEIPTVDEVGLSALSLSTWYGLFAPRNTDLDIIHKLGGAAAEALEDWNVKSRLAALEAEVFPSEQRTPEALATLMKADAEKWLPRIKELAINPQ